MLEFRDFKSQIDQWRKEKKWALIAASAKKRLEAMGYQELPLGSYCRWIEPADLKKALMLGVLKENKYGQFVPVAFEKVEEKVTGKVGRETIKEYTRVLDYSKFQNWAASYELRQFAKRKEMEYVEVLSSQMTLGEIK